MRFKKSEEESNLDTAAAAAQVIAEKEKRQARALKFGLETKEMDQAKKAERVARFGNDPDKQAKMDEKKKRDDRAQRFGDEGGKKERKNPIDLSLDDYKLRGKDHRHKGKTSKKPNQNGNKQADRRKKAAGFKSAKPAKKKGGNFKK